ncbi:hypothetical protein TRAPUB_7692 [Trametes pubescens]|uniref:Uncharacterized protein n=1 Tax=Trametes pubescens TaxID=154538 RepID=A0A1M2V2P9_TRAPU|nr:hypothetical protein TRAPUB_7692 [Trametes pubescens]
MRNIDNGARAVLERMVHTGAKVTRVSRTFILNHLKQLVEVDRLSRDSTFTEHSLLKDEELVKLKVHRAKNTTKKELYDENIELQEELEKTVARLGGVIKDLGTAQRERNAAIKERDTAQEELRRLRRNATPRPSTPTPGAQDIDTDENARANTPSTSAQNSGPTLQRVPTMPDISMPPKTPNRDASTHSLLTPPPTDEHNPRRLARHPSSLSYRDDFEEHPKGRPMDVSGQSQTYGAAIDASGSYTQLQGATASSARVADMSEETIQRRPSEIAVETARTVHSVPEGPGIQDPGASSVQPPSVTTPMLADGHVVTFGDVYQLLHTFEMQQIQRILSISLRKLTPGTLGYLRPRSRPYPARADPDVTRLSFASRASLVRIKTLEKDESGTERFINIIGRIECEVEVVVRQRRRRHIHPVILHVHPCPDLPKGDAEGQAPREPGLVLNETQR